MELETPIVAPQHGQERAEIYRREGAMLRARKRLAGWWYLRRATWRGKHVHVNGRLIVSNEGGTLIVGDGVAFRATVAPCELLVHRSGRLQIGHSTFINYGSSIAAAGSVTIGKNCLIGQYCAIMDTEYHGLLDRGRAPVPRPVNVGDNVWLGTRVVVLPGVTIGEGSVVGAGSIVTRNVPPYCLAAGVPAQVIRRLEPPGDSRPPSDRTSDFCG
jgi:acetyltransferase-like isoleucine patch superfamily enzyme